MPSNNDQFNSLLKLLLPEELFEYFEIVNVLDTGGSVNIHLEELNIAPEGYNQKELTNKGFHKTAKVQDFPIRDKTCYLYVKRRRWTVNSTGKTISRDWELLAKGTRYTKGFASFLKGLFGQLPNQR